MVTEVAFDIGVLWNCLPLTGEHQYLAVCAGPAPRDSPYARPLLAIRSCFSFSVLFLKQGKTKIGHRVSVHDIQIFLLSEFADQDQECVRRMQSIMCMG